MASVILVAILSEASTTSTFTTAVSSILTCDVSMASFIFSAILSARPLSSNFIVPSLRAALAYSTTGLKEWYRTTISFTKRVL